MHAHPAGCTIALTGQQARLAMPNGTVEEFAAPRGTVECGDSFVHQAENIASGPQEAIPIELRNRRTWNAAMAQHDTPHQSAIGEDSLPPDPIRRSQTRADASGKAAGTA
jgi:hypothetical protein